MFADEFVVGRRSEKITKFSEKRSEPLRGSYNNGVSLPLLKSAARYPLGGYPVLHSKLVILIFD